MGWVSLLPRMHSTQFKGKHTFHGHFLLHLSRLRYPPPNISLSLSLPHPCLSSLSLNTANSVSDPVYMSRTKAEYNDDDLYDSLARTAPSPSPSESTTDSDLEEDEDEWCLVRAGLEVGAGNRRREKQAVPSVMADEEKRWGGRTCVDTQGVAAYAMLSTDVNPIDPFCSPLHCPFRAPIIAIVPG